jgi:hypothetical protein
MAEHDDKKGALSGEPLTEIPEEFGDTAVADSLRELLRLEKSRYIEGKKEQGGTAEGFRERIRRQYGRDPRKFDSLVLDALMEATTKNWQAPPRKRGKDLFAIHGITLPEYLTRPAVGPVTGEELDDDEKFEKVSQKFATVDDLASDTTIKLRKAAQSSAAANQLALALDEARRRARGNGAAFLHDLMDDS